MNHSLVISVTLLCLFVAACSKPPAHADSSDHPTISAELVGEWGQQGGNGELFLRADGLAAWNFGGATPMGCGCLGTYDPTKGILTLSLRPSPGDLPKDAKPLPDFIADYDAKDQSITIKPQVAGMRGSTFKRQSKDLSEPYKSFDLRKLPPSISK